MAQKLIAAADDAEARGMEARAATLLGYAEHHIAVLEQEQALIGLMQRLGADTAFEQVDVTGHVVDTPVESAPTPSQPVIAITHKPKRLTKQARQVAAGQINFLEAA